MRLRAILHETGERRAVRARVAGRRRALSLPDPARVVHHKGSGLARDGTTSTDGVVDATVAAPNVVLATATRSARGADAITARGGVLALVRMVATWGGVGEARSPTVDFIGNKRAAVALAALEGP